MFRAVIDDPQMLARVQAVTEHFFRTHCIDFQLSSYAHSENLQYDLKEGKYAVFHMKDGSCSSVRKTLSQVFEELKKR